MGARPGNLQQADTASLLLAPGELPAVQGTTEEPSQLNQLKCFETHMFPEN